MASQPRSHSGRGKWLVDVIVAARGIGFVEQSIISTARHENDRRAPVLFHSAKRSAQRDSVHPRHLDIDYETVNLQLVRERERPLARLRFDQIVAVGLEQSPQHASGGMVVVCNENGSYHYQIPLPRGRGWRETPG